MAPQQTLKDLYQKILDGRADTSEKDLFDRWFNQLNLSEQHAFLSKEEEENLMRRMQSRISAHTSHSNQTKLHQRIWWRVAAAILLFISSGAFYLLTQKPQKSPVYTSVTAPDNKPKQIKLADGSIVTLNSGAELHWDDYSFNTSVRRVRLTGEAVFKVQHDRKRPFIVETDELETTVLGTTFNIEHYPNEKHIKVSLLEGALKINPAGKSHDYIMLKPGEMADYNRDIRKTTVLPLHIANVDIWTSGGLAFNEVTLPDALERMAQRYKIIIQFDPKQLENKTVSAEFEQISWQEALEAILFPHDLHYTEKDDKITIATMN